MQYLRPVFNGNPTALFLEYLERLDLYPEREDEFRVWYQAELKKMVSYDQPTPT